MRSHFIGRANFDDRTVNSGLAERSPRPLLFPPTVPRLCAFDERAASVDSVRTESEERAREHSFLRRGTAFRRRTLSTGERETESV
jgi:hypothetical protein